MPIRLIHYSLFMFNFAHAATMVCRFYSRRHRYVLVANFGANETSLAEIGRIYSGGQLVLDTTNKLDINTDVLFSNISLPSGQAVVIKLPKWLKNRDIILSALQYYNWRSPILLMAIAKQIPSESRFPFRSDLDSKKCIPTNAVFTNLISYYIHITHDLWWLIKKQSKFPCFDFFCKKDITSIYIDRFYKKFYK